MDISSFNYKTPDNNYEKYDNLFFLKNNKYNFKMDETVILLKNENIYKKELIDNTIKKKNNLKNNRKQFIQNKLKNKKERLIERKLIINNTQNNNPKNKKKNKSVRKVKQIKKKVNIENMTVDFDKINIIEQKRIQNSIERKKFLEIKNKQTYVKNKVIKKLDNLYKKIIENK